MAPASNFKGRTVKGLRWGVIDQMVNMLTLQLTMIVLMRILGPEEFGIIGMTNVFFNFANILVIFGIPAFIIQRAEINDKILSTCFWLNLAFGGLIAILMFGISPAVGAFYREPRVTEILALMSLFFIVESFSYVQRAMLNRDLNIKDLFKARFLSMILSCLIAIYLAIVTQSVWALVARIGLYKLFFTLTTIYFNRWWPQFTFDRKLISPILNFTMPLLGSNSLQLFVRNVDIMIVGRWFGTFDTGIYGRSYSILNLPVSNISRAINRVMFASFSKIQNEPERIIDTFLKVNKTTAFITFPLMGVLFVLAPYFVLGVFGSEWKAMIPLMRVMSLGGIVFSVAALIPNIFVALNRTRIHFYNTIVTSVLTIAGIVVGAFFGILGVAVGVSVGIFIGYLPGVWWVRQVIGLSMKRHLSNYLPIASVSLLFGILLFATDHFFYQGITEHYIADAKQEIETSIIYLIHLVVLGIFSIFAYIGLMEVFGLNLAPKILRDFLSDRIYNRISFLWTIKK
ncbi:MAG: oligosaccharide flippase family protein [Bacteroidetes bacterium]|nr:oligosaccharide flippase family protein [Bacteroidota bacterium]